MMTLSIASWFQEILEMTSEEMLEINHQKLTILQYYLLKNNYDNSLIYQYPFLWQKRVKRKEDEKKNKIEIELKDIIHKYEFEWLLNDIFNWEKNIFITKIMNQFLYSIK